MANRIMLNETSYHGAGAIQEIATEAKAHGFQKAFVCSDPDLIKFGVTKKVTDVLDKNGLCMRFIPISNQIQPSRMSSTGTGIQGFRCRLPHCNRRRLFHGYFQSHRYHHCQSGI